MADKNIQCKYTNSKKQGIQTEKKECQCDCHAKRMHLIRQRK